MLHYYVIGTMHVSWSIGLLLAITVLVFLPLLVCRNYMPTVQSTTVAIG